MATTITTQNDLIKKNEEALQAAKDLTITPTDQQLLNIRNDISNLKKIIIAGIVFGIVSNFIFFLIIYNIL